MIWSRTKLALLEILGSLCLAMSLSLAIDNPARAVDIQAPDPSWLQNHLGAPTLRKGKDDASDEPDAKGKWVVLDQEGRHAGENGFVFASNWPLYDSAPNSDEDTYWRTFVALAAVDGKKQILADMYEVTDLFPSDKDYGVGATMKARINRIAGCRGKTILEVVIERRRSGNGLITNTADFWFELQDSRKLRLLATQLDVDWSGRAGYDYAKAQKSKMTSIRGNDYCAFEITSVKEDRGGDRGANPKKSKAEHLFLKLSDDGSRLEQVKALPPRPADAKVSKVSRQLSHL
jgi:hypothetical protein